MHEMEKLLVIWMEDLIQKQIPLSLAIIKTKARSLFEMLKLKEEKAMIRLLLQATAGFKNLGNERIFKM